MGACTAGGGEKPQNHTSSTSSFRFSPDASAGSTRQSRLLTFHPVGVQVVEVSHLQRFLTAYNAGQVHTALAQFSRTQTLGFSDCDYSAQQVVAGHGRARLANWLQTNVADHDRLAVAHIYGADPDQPVLGVSFSRRSSDSITHAGHPDGITPPIGAKVKFDQTGLITQFNNGPVGGPPDSCRIA